MKVLLYSSILFLIVLALFFQILSFMHLFPLYISSPLLFLCLFLALSMLNNRKRFKGF
ncbi:hypothetical protein V1498_16320 [Peribacillus sp. SCS-26]|uniref:hypothetical protein n=1 Tax=Paraperibacillus marinus TaxID=3115295 RepID=UPI003905C191